MSRWCDFSYMLHPINDIAYQLPVKTAKNQGNMLSQSGVAISSSVLSTKHILCKMVTV